MNNLILQRHSFDCAVACIAMFVSVSYEEVAEYHKKTTGFQQGLSFMEIFNSLKHFGLQPCVMNMFPHPKPCLLVVPSLNKPAKKHMIVWDGYNVKDPSSKKVYNNLMLLRNGCWSTVFGSLKNERTKWLYEYEREQLKL